MPRLAAPFLLLFLFISLPAHAVIKGSAASTHGLYTVRLVGNGNCSGVVIARNAVATAAHCARGMQVIVGGRSFRVANISHSAVLDDGRRVSVSGDAASCDLPRRCRPTLTKPCICSDSPRMIAQGILSIGTL